MRLSRWAAFAAAPAVLMTGLHITPPAPAAKTYANPTCLDTTVPLYSPAMWTTAQGTKPEANIGIANWGSNTQNTGQGGPGKSKSSGDAAMINKARASGTRILGYIATNYATSDPGYTVADIEIQMTDWHSWYGVTTFFLDEAPTATTHESYYATLKSWATAHIGSSAKEWLNMGAYPAASSWMSDANTIMDWESNTDPTTPPSWVKNFPPSRFAMVLNDVPGTAGDIAEAVSDIEGAHAQNGFVTSDSTYQTLPTWAYWTMFGNDAAGTGCS
jgi:hypothetical protein